MSKEKIDHLLEEVYAKLEEIGQLAVETNTPTSFSVPGCWTNYEVFVPELEDEEMVEYLEQESNKQPGDWVSSSERC